MTMYDESHENKRIIVSCRNCDRHISFIMIPKAEVLVGVFFCNLKCIDEYETKKAKR